MIKNKTMTIISNNCIGGVIYNELGLKFNSPTINLYIYPSDFVKFCSNIKHYLNKELTFIESKENFPVARLDDIKIYFMHYKTSEEANIKWKERSKRIKFDNIYFIMVDKDGCSNDDKNNFDKLPYKNKVILTNKEKNNFKSSFYIPGFENSNEIGNLMSYKSLLGHKYYDKFNFVKWFNSK